MAGTAARAEWLPRAEAGAAPRDGGVVRFAEMGALATRRRQRDPPRLARTRRARRRPSRRRRRRRRGRRRGRPPPRDSTCSHRPYGSRDGATRSRSTGRTTSSSSAPSRRRSRRASWSGEPATTGSGSRPACARRNESLDVLLMTAHRRRRMTALMAVDGGRAPANVDPDRHGRARPRRRHSRSIVLVGCGGSDDESAVADTAAATVPAPVRRPPTRRRPRSRRPPRRRPARPRRPPPAPRRRRRRPPTTTTVPIVLPQPVAPPLDEHGIEPVIEVGSIEIPAIDVYMAMYEGIRLTTLDNGPGHWPGTAMPGHIGNAVVGGHRTSKHKVFRNLDQLVPGDEIIFDGVDGRHVYHVTRTEIVDSRRDVDRRPDTSVHGDAVRLSSAGLDPRAHRRVRRARRLSRPCPFARCVIARWRTRRVAAVQGTGPQPRRRSARRVRAPAVGFLATRDHRRDGVRDVARRAAVASPAPSSTAGCSAPDGCSSGCAGWCSSPCPATSPPARSTPAPTPSPPSPRQPARGG